MAEDTTTAVDAWAIQHRGHNVTREAEQSIRCITCMRVMWATSPVEADEVYAAMRT